MKIIRLLVPALLLVGLHGAVAAAVKPIPVENFSFEAGDGKPDGWKLEPSWQWSMALNFSDDARHGAKSAKVSGQCDIWDPPRAEFLLKRMPEGDIITVGVWAKLNWIQDKCDDVKNKGLHIYVRVKDANDNSINYEILKDFKRTGFWKWHFNSKDIDIPAGYKEAVLVADLKGYGGEVLVDKVVVVRGRELPPETLTTSALVGTKAEVVKGAITRVREALKNKPHELTTREAIDEAKARAQTAILLARKLAEEAAGFTSDKIDARKTENMRALVRKVKEQVNAALAAVGEAEAVEGWDSDFEAAEGEASAKLAEALALLEKAEETAQEAEIVVGTPMALLATWGGGIYRAKPNEPHKWEKTNPKAPHPRATFLEADLDGAVYCGGVDKFLYDSHDNGKTWSRTPTPLPVVATGFAFDPEDRTRWIISSWGEGLWQSVDQGRNWTALAGSPAFSWGLLCVKDGGGRELYVVEDHVRIMRARNLGGPWNKIASMPRGIKARDLALRPGEKKTILVATDAGLAEISSTGKVTFPKLEAPSADARSITVDGDRILIGTWGRGVVEWKPLDSPPSARLINEGIENPSVFALAVSRNPKKVASEEDILVGPRVWTNINPELGAYQVNGIVANPSNEKLMFCSTEGGMYRSVDSGLTWEATNEGLVGANVGRIVMDPNNSDVVYVGAATVANPRAVGVQKMRRVDENTLAWDQKNEGLEGNLAAMWLEMNPDNANEIYAATWGGGVYRTSDGGDRWESFSQGLTVNLILCVMTGKVSPKDIFVGTFRGGIFKWDAVKWEWASATNGLTSPTIWHIAQDPFNGKAWLAGTYEGGLFKSDDAGETWRKMTRGLPINEISRIAYHPTKRNIVYLGSQAGGGIYRSADAGETWAEDNTGLTVWDIQDIFINKNGLVYVGTPNGIFYKQD